MLTITRAYDELLERHGITLVRGNGFDMKAMMATYLIRDRNGDEEVVTSADLMELLK